MEEFDKLGYVTIEPDAGGLDYRTIADIMTVDGHVMGHSTVRNIIMRTMEKFAASLMAANGVVDDPAVVARGPSFQKMIASYVQEIYASGTLEQIKNEKF